jgi:excisionase family DNA binding protein
LGARAKDRTGDRGEQVLTVDQVADYLQLNRLTVYRYIRERRIPASRIGKLYRVLKADVDRFLEVQKVGGRTAPARRAAPPASERVRAIRPRVASERDVYVGPLWHERAREREALTDSTETGTSDPIEWVLRGLH